jgi:hypothetical protein
MVNILPLVSGLASYGESLMVEYTPAALDPITTSSQPIDNDLIDMMC